MRQILRQAEKDEIMEFHRVLHEITFERFPYDDDVPHYAGHPKEKGIIESAG